MASYIYETIPSDGGKPRRYELSHSMKDPALTHHPETGEPIRRVITGGYGYVPGAGTKVDPFSDKQFMDVTGARKGSLGDLFDRSKEWSDMRAAKAGGDDPVKTKFHEDWSKKHKNREHPDATKSRITKELKKKGIRLE